MNSKINKLCAILLAKVIKDEYQDNVVCASYGINEKGFYYDFKFKKVISINEFEAISRKIEQLINSNPKIECSNLENNLLGKIFKGNSFKKDVSETKKIIIAIDNFFDLIDEPLDLKALDIKKFKLDNLSACYWENSSDNISLTRISGFAFDNEKEFNDHLLFLEDQKARDHRKIGQDLELFTFSKLIGQGLPIWLPRGTVVKKQITSYLDKILSLNGFNFTATPVLGTVDLYKISEHWGHYKDTMFPLMDVDGELLVLRPMTCPHQIVTFLDRPKSYRDLPYRMAEQAILHRYEASGGLTGLERVRQMELIDTHTFCTPDQIHDEIRNYFEIIKKVQKNIGLKIHQIDLSLHSDDKAKFHQDEAMWNHAESQLRNALNQLGVEYQEVKGEAAFYGPKIDIQVKTALGRIITLSTIQLDFLLPGRFKVVYKDKDGSEKTPILIHCGIVGSLERLVSIILEQTKGVLPLWLAPVQVVIIPINNDKHYEYCNNLRLKLIRKGIRANIDNSDEKLGKKIRNSQIQKVPYQVIIGDNEMENKANVTFRRYGEKDSVTLPLNDFVDKLIKKVEEQTNYE